MKMDVKPIGSFKDEDDYYEAGFGGVTKRTTQSVNHNDIYLRALRK